MIPKKLTRQVICEKDYPIAHTKHGKLRGLVVEGTFVFRGVQYATAKRFHMPEEPKSWDDVKNAIVYGPVCLEQRTPVAHDQYNVPHYHYVQAEECQYLNIWSQHLGDGAKRPVMVWLHGGGYDAGSSIELYAYDGMNLSQFGDVVVVSLNHRLNLLGYMNLDQYGEEYKYSGNAGTADIVMALRWIRDNIAAFGGDPDNVTIMGQSGGGKKVNDLTQTPAANGLFHKAILQSCMKIDNTPTTVELSHKITERIIDVLGVDRNNIKVLETIAYRKLAQASLKALAQLSDEEGSRVTWRPTVDFDYFMGNTQLYPVTEHSKTIPMIIGTCLGEHDTNYNHRLAPGGKDSWDDELVNSLMSKKYGQENLEPITAALKKAYPKLSKADSLFIDRSSRIPHRDLCRTRSELGCAPVWNYIFALMMPVNNGTTAWHNSEEAYMFYNAEYLEASYIPGISQQLQKEMAGAWAAFAEKGDPNHAGMPVWENVHDGNGACMIFDEDTRCLYHHDDELMDAIPYIYTYGKKKGPTPVPKAGGGPRRDI